MRKVDALAIAVLVLMAAMFPHRHVRAQAGTKRVEVTASRFTFAPADITLKKGQPVTLLLKSADVAHGLRFRELNVNIKVDKGQSGEVTFTPAVSGDFVGHCSGFCGAGHGAMALTLHVVD